MKHGLFLLEDGTHWEGSLFGTERKVFGEAVFNTAFAGYEELLTDPSYAGQIVVMATPHLGNYGVNREDMESSKCHLKGFVIKELSPVDSNWRSKMDLQHFLAEQEVVGISGVDTRGIVKHLREHGAMRAVIAPFPCDVPELLSEVRHSPSMMGANFVQEVSTRKMEHHKGEGSRVVLYDFGLKQNILRNLLKENLEVFVLPSTTPAEEALKLKPKGILLSNGPGDPAASSEEVRQIRELLKSELPTLGICLGYQILGLALGAKTYKLKFGHRGVNHPVKNLETGAVAITSHNHGFSVDAASLPNSLVPTYQDLYDNTLEGFRHQTSPFFGVQFHPESAPGPHDAHPIFHQFTNWISHLS